MALFKKKTLRDTLLELKDNQEKKIQKVKNRYIDYESKIDQENRRLEEHNFNLKIYTESKEIALIRDNTILANEYDCLIERTLKYIETIKLKRSKLINYYNQFREIFKGLQENLDAKILEFENLLDTLELSEIQEELKSDKKINNKEIFKTFNKLAQELESENAKTIARLDVEKDLKTTNI